MAKPTMPTSADQAACERCAEHGDYVAAETEVDGVRLCGECAAVARLAEGAGG